MSLQIQASKSLITPDLDRKMKGNIARKIGYKQVDGDLYKQRTRWNRFTDFIGSTRAVSVVGKSHFEGKQYVQAALLRKDHQANLQAQGLGRDLYDMEYNDAVWNSNGLQNRMMREDFVRYSKQFHTEYDKASDRNKWANRFSRTAHALHGGCEMFAAPTGMTSNVVKNAATGGVDEKSNTNKLFMFATLGFIGVGTTELLKAVRGGTGEIGTFLGQALSGVLMAFPAGSSLLGFLGLTAGLASQATVQKQFLTKDQKTDIAKDLGNNLQKLLSQLKGAKDNPELTKKLATAMQGKYQIVKKIGSNSLDDKGIPIILNRVLDAIDLSKSDTDNMNAMKSALGEYLHVEKPEKPALWSRYSHARQVTSKESHYVALVSLVDHMEVGYPLAAELQDARRYTEEKLAVRFHDAVLTYAAKKAEFVDSVANTKIAPTLLKWADKDARAQRKKDMANPANSARFSRHGEYMAKHSHQYGPVTRSLILMAEGIRLINMNIVLASNANLSRIFNNAGKLVHNAVGTSPASRSMCHNLGRFLGGAVLAIIFGTIIPIAVEATDGSTSIETGNNFPVDFSVTNIGILMFIFSVPTLAIQGLAQLAVRVEGWNGDVAKSAPSGVDTFRFTPR